MAWRNLGDDPASLNFVGKFAPRPLRDGTLLRLFTCQGQHLAGLLGRNLRRSTGTRLIGEPFADRSISERNALLRQPAFAPGPHRIHTHALLPRDLAIVLANIGCQDDPSTQRHLLRRVVPPHQRLQLASLLLVQAQGFWFWSSHGWALFLSVYPSLLRSQYTTELFQPQCTSFITTFC